MNLAFDDEVTAAPPGTIDTEEMVPAYVLPNVLVCADGSFVESTLDWETKRRPEILQMLTEKMFGKVPTASHVKVTFRTDDKAVTTWNDKVMRKQIAIVVSNGTETREFNLLIFQPVSDQPVPVFLGLNFAGNHTVHADPAIKLPTSWVNESMSKGSKSNKASEEGRGARNFRWPVETILARGYALATIYYGDIDPDFDDGFQNGVHPLFYPAGQSKPAADEWGSIAAWTWGLSQAVDFIETDKSLNAKQISVIGHSRLGKTSLWAGATDQRIAITISNDSGCGGAAISRRHFGETVKMINDRFPHWFCANYRAYNDKENEAPFDQHELIALMAPRPVYIASATEDLWADPRGEYLSGHFATPVYELYKRQGLPSEDPPAPEHPLKTTSIGYHARIGKHNILDYDWQQYLDFADLHFKQN